jgi:hypothetical protein
MPIASGSQETFKVPLSGLPSVSVNTLTTQPLVLVA